jgi:beta-glucosidase
MKDIGLKSSRFSIEWSRIEPQQGVIDKSAIQHYHDVIDEHIKQGIQPMITLHHFTHPIWFEKLGGFAETKNIAHFVKFSETVFKEYSTKVKLWCTINEPEVFFYFGYIDGTFPPGVKSFKTGEQVLKNLLESHVQIYHKLKSLPNGRESRIGLVKDIFQGDPYTWWNPIHWIVSFIYNHIMNESILNFFETGKFKFYPFITSHANPLARKSMDFIGLNYYSHLHFKPTLTNPFAMATRKEDRALEMGYTMYPEGLYRALKRLGHFGVPVIITENGIGDSKDIYREMFLKRYLYAIHQAMVEGINVRGYYYWTLMDNFEWAHGYKQKFGLYSYDEKTNDVRWRKGSNFFKEVVQKFNRLSKQTGL